MVEENAPRADQQSHIERRVATIMHADIAGYSRLMGENEERTVRVFRGHREIFESLVKMHRGRIFNTAGDALLAEFQSSVEAVRCATEIQAALHTRNEHLPPNERLHFRIGINLGDVILQGGDLLGDGVNIAARVQTAAEPGGVSISGSVYDQIQNKLTLNIQPLGEKTFKNIAQAVRTYSIVSGDNFLSTPKKHWQTAVLGSVGILLIMIVGYFGYQEYANRQAAAAHQAAEAAAKEAARKTDEAKKQVEILAQQQASAETARKSADFAMQQAELLAQRRAAEETARKAADERKRLEEERRTITEAKQASVAKSSVSPAPSVATARPGLAADVARFNGTYLGRICNHYRSDPEKRSCWAVTLQVQNGALTATWKSGVSGEPSWMKGAIGVDGAVAVMIDAWSRRTKLSISASLAGQWANEEIRLSGTWANGQTVSARLQRAQ